MYSLASNLKGQPIISLQTGQPVGWIDQPVLNMANLEVVAFTCRAPHRPHLVLVARDIRQFAADCLIVDDEDELTEPGDIVRLKSNLANSYSPIGKRVLADTGRRLGSVEDYSINLESSRVQRLYVRRPLWRTWFSSSLIIDRTQIIDVTPEQIIVRDATMTESVIAPDTLPEIHP